MKFLENYLTYAVCFQLFMGETSEKLTFQVKTTVKYVTCFCRKNKILISRIFLHRIEDKYFFPSHLFFTDEHLLYLDLQIPFEQQGFSKQHSRAKHIISLRLSL